MLVYLYKFLVFSGKKQDFQGISTSLPPYLTDTSDDIDAAQSMQVLDADLPIVQTEISTSEIGKKSTVLGADDTAILILLLLSLGEHRRHRMFRPEACNGTRKQPRCGDYVHDYVMTSFLKTPLFDVIQHHMNMFLEN